MTEITPQDLAVYSILLFINKWRKLNNCVIGNPNNEAYINKLNEIVSKYICVTLIR